MGIAHTDRPFDLNYKHGRLSFVREVGMVQLCGSVIENVSDKLAPDFHFITHTSIIYVKDVRAYDP